MIFNKMKTSKEDLFLEYWFIKRYNKPYRLGEHYCNRLGKLYCKGKDLSLVKDDLLSEKMLDTFIEDNNLDCFDLPVNNR